MDPPRFLVGFNLPDLKLPTGKRDVTNVPNQALILMNDPFVMAQAEEWSTRLIQQPADTVERSGVEPVESAAVGGRDAETIRNLVEVRMATSGLPESR